MRVAIIDNTTNKVENIIVTDSVLTLTNKTCIASDIAAIGDDYDGVEFIKSIVAPVDDIIAEAKFALFQTDKVAIRCVKAGVSFPLEWQNYVSDLRDVVNGINDILPTQPDYPAGT